MNGIYRPRIGNLLLEKPNMPVATAFYLSYVVGIVVFVVAWVALHLVFAVLHIVELIGVAIIAGYIGWLAGDRHGRRAARREAKKG